MATKGTSPLDRLIAAATSRHQELGWAMDPCKGKWPRLWQWLTSTDAGEEFIKEPGVLTLKATLEGWQGTLSDRSFGCSVDSTSETLEGVFQALEDMLASNNPVVRTWPNHKMQLKRRPKKT